MVGIPPPRDSTPVSAWIWLRRSAQRASNFWAGLLATHPARFAQALALASITASIPVARVGADGPGDGLYRRFDGDFTLTTGVGGGVAWGEEGSRGTFVGELRLRHLDAAGPFVAAEWGPSRKGLAVVGVEIRPLFPALFLENRFFGYEFWDLLIQSVGVELGAAILPTNGSTVVGLAFGFGLEVPLVSPRRFARGVWLRLAARRVRGGPVFQAVPDRARSEWTAYAALAVKASLGAGVAGTEPPRYRIP